MESICVRRFNLHTGDKEKKGYIKSHEEVFDFCLKHNIIGTGWGTEEKEYSIENFKKAYPNGTGGVRAMNGLEDMKENDLIWTRRKSEYYLCRVIGNKTYHISNNKDIFEQQKKEYSILKDIEYQELHDCDIWNFVECEYCYIGTETEVFGSVVNSMKAGGVTQKVSKGGQALIEYSKKKYNENKKGKYRSELKKIKDKWEYFWNYIGADELEELVGLYLQVEKNYGIYTSTNKHDTIHIEFVLFDRKTGEKAFLQVKEHDINIYDYIELSKQGIVYIFSNNDTEYESINNIVRITRKQIEEFCNNRKHKKFLPGKIKYIFEN